MCLTALVFCRVGQDQGVVGTLKCLSTKKIAEQPIVSLDWNASKMGLAVTAALDQTLKVVIVTKLQNY